MEGAGRVGRRRRARAGRRRAGGGEKTAPRLVRDVPCGIHTLYRAVLKYVYKFMHRLGLLGEERESEDAAVCMYW